MAGPTISSRLYSLLFRRTSTFALTIVVGALFFERAFDQGADADGSPGPALSSGEDNSPVPALHLKHTWLRRDTEGWLLIFTCVRSPNSTDSSSGCLPELPSPLTTCREATGAAGGPVKVWPGTALADGLRPGQPGLRQPCGRPTVEPLLTGSIWGGLPVPALEELGGPAWEGPSRKPAWVPPASPGRGRPPHWVWGI
uniref:Cytochrome b-c1 complex subunit 9 n=1 Tax=Oryctolagus cuniculus TaxID=9986 RepID=A0A5F9CP89_RABIT